MAKISKISVGGFKTLAKKQSIELSNLTVIAGPNSGGKSSFMQPLLLIKQTLESDFDPGTFLINGAHVKFNEIDQLFSILPTGNRASRIVLEFYGDDFELSLTYRKNRSKGLHLAKLYTKDSDNLTDGVEFNGHESSATLRKMFPSKLLGL